MALERTRSAHGRRLIGLDARYASQPAGLSTAGGPKARCGISIGAVRDNREPGHWSGAGPGDWAMQGETDRGNELAPQLGAADEGRGDPAGRSVFCLIFRHRGIAPAADRWRFPYASTTQD